MKASDIVTNEALLQVLARRGSMTLHDIVEDDEVSALMGRYRAAAEVIERLQKDRLVTLQREGDDVRVSLADAPGSANSLGGAPEVDVEVLQSLERAASGAQEALDVYVSTVGDPEVLSQLMAAKVATMAALRRIRTAEGRP